MNKTLSQRITMLEHRRTATRQGGVVVAADLIEFERIAQRDRRAGGCLVVPGMATDVEQWEREAAAEQSALKASVVML